MFTIEASFTLIEDGRTIFRSPECTTLAERIAEIFGRQTSESLVPIENAEPDEQFASDHRGHKSLSKMAEPIEYRPSAEV